MLSAARYPYLNRAFHRGPDSYDKGRAPGPAVVGSPLLLAILAHAGYLLPMYSPATTVSPAMPNPILALRHVWRSIADKAGGLWQRTKKFFS